MRPGQKRKVPYIFVDREMDEVIIPVWNKKRSRYSTEGRAVVIELMKRKSIYMSMMAM